ncbi:GNAT family N-acetyltransferase [Paenibacillus sp. CC-CFT747]|nr:GNAT family N-acetyltransferase [Paenibacillus sp. CC-CFT747]
MQQRNRASSGFVEHSTYWLVRGSRIVGVVNLRHRLNEKLLRIGGHIGYGIRPGERRKGYATAILAMALQKAGERGIQRVLVTCDKDNTGSARTIQKNGGVLESEAWEGETCVQRYWIEVT